MSRSPMPFTPAKPSPARILARTGPDPRWRPGLNVQPFHSEIFAPATEASGAGLALALARDALAAAGESDDTRQILWVQDRAAIRLGGRPCLAGLPRDLAHRLIHVAAATPEDALFALEEGLKCRDLACVIGEIAGNPKALSFTASRRLSLTAEKHGVRLWLVRLDAAPDLSSARMRWQARAAPSAAPRWNPAAPGMATWHAELFRARTHAPGQWSLSDDAGTLRIASDPPTETVAAPDPRYLARPTVGRSLAARVHA
ncbi:recA-like protein [Erythrobacter sp. BLCC-B19]|uniref:recA-like protein n=1 Tax=Erythrobacter sp. BLCC-B19 TaxID=3025315 RepID=UPI0023604169|nr:recA-like protein [Erythrobacter sp. BLCC-B19]WDA40793.1 recA-like protein [Erythrobacter sp. BLCC-B19]